VSRIREERDALGIVEVPSDAYYGGFTKRALDNFRISGLTIDPEFVRALVEVKMTAARTNAELGLLDEDVAKAILRAAGEILEGKFDGEFPLDVFQAGAGTPWNMNVNEVIANRANEFLGSGLGVYDRVHPNDHVNMSQSSNDAVPTAARMAALKLEPALVEKLAALEESLRAKSEEFDGIIKSGRTHFRDAVPITLGQEFGAFASMVGTSRRRLEASMESLRELFLGGTAVGTGLNTHPGYSEKALEHLKSITGLELERAEDFVEKTQFPSDFLEAMDALGEMASDFFKMGNDLMLLSSGPRTGLGELALLPVEPGSSIMPGKVNPSVVECFNMVCLQVMGNRAAVQRASMSGSLNMNVYVPLITFNLLNSLRWMTNAVGMLDRLCVRGLEARREAAERHLTESNALATLLSPVLGYDGAAELAEEALERGLPIGTLVLEKGVLTEEQWDELVGHSTAPNMHIVERIRKQRSRKAGATR
jgi:aspartate ammonia-lyase